MLTVRYLQDEVCSVPTEEVGAAVCGQRRVQVVEGGQGVELVGWNTLGETEQVTGVITSN